MGRCTVVLTITPREWKVLESPAPMLSVLKNADPNPVFLCALARDSFIIAFEGFSGGGSEHSYLEALQDFSSKSGYTFDVGVTGSETAATDYTIKPAAVSQFARVPGGGANA